MQEFLSPGGVTDWIATWGYLGIFCCVFIGNFGVPMPEETVVLAAGFLAGREILNLKVVAAVVLFSAVFGDNCGYWAGRTGGQRALERLSRSFSFAHRRYERFKLFFRSHGSKTVFLARFLPGFVPGARRLYAPALVAIAKPRGKVETSRLHVGAVYDEHGTRQQELYVSTPDSIVGGAIQQSLADAGLRPAAVDAAKHPEY